MNDRDRLEQLRVLLHRLERMPASADRDWMLSEVRRRAVDVETGETPRALRSLPREDPNVEIAPARVASREAVDTVARQSPATPAKPSHQPTLRAALSAPMSPSTPVPVRETAGYKAAVDLLEQGGLLCLGDPAAGTAAASHPWSGSLRG